MNRILLILTFSVFSITAFSQATSSIKGAVRDVETEEPLSRASIQIKGSSTQISTTSDYEGYYRLDNVPVGEVTVEVKYIGYQTMQQTVTIKADEDFVLDFNIKPSVTELNEVVISKNSLHFKHMTLFDDDGEVEEERNINGFYALEIYKDAVTDEIWGLGKTSQTNIRESKDVYYKGTQSLELEWDKDYQKPVWIGMGIGWDQWSGKNVARVEDSCGIQFFMRTAAGTMKNLVIVFQLEDYGGSQCAAVMKDNNFYGGKMLDEHWTKVIIPFSAFDVDRDLVDWTNIKQLQMQFEVKAHIFIDEMEIVKLPEEYYNRKKSESTN